jgi:diguanylate cyclase (GGDEF)-like protein
MQVAPLPETEYARLMALARYEVLDSPPEESFERITALVREVLGVPMVMINFVDQFRNWSQSCVGGERGETPRGSSFCTWAILDREPTIITDARQDPRFAQNPGVLGAPFVRFYGGVPLITPDGHAIGTLCVVDSQARPFGEREIWLLKNFAQLVVEALELRVRELELTRQVAASAAQMENLRRVTAHAETLAAITALFDEDLEPVLAAEASAALLSQAVDVDWTGLLVLTGDELQVLTAWDHRAERHSSAAPVDLSAYIDGATGLSARQQRSSFIDDYPAHARALPHFVEMGVRAAAALPLGTYDGSNYVLVTVRQRAQPWLSSDRALCEAAARSIRGSLERRAHLRAVEVAAGRDPLTGVGNRRAFDRALVGVGLDGAGPPYAVLMIDLNGMKGVNDREGHERGDELLQLFARSLELEFAPQAGVYRLGGDEFALLWGALSEEAGGEMLRGVDRVAGIVRAGGFASVSASAGLAYSSEVSADLAPAVVRLADARMYRHKRHQSMSTRAAG